MLTLLAAPIFVRFSVAFTKSAEELNFRVHLSALTRFDILRFTEQERMLIRTESVGRVTIEELRSVYMPIKLPEDITTFSLEDAQSVGTFANGYCGAIIGALLIEAKVVASNTQLRSLIEQGEVELVRGEDSDAALGDVFSYSPRKVIHNHKYIDALFPGDVIRVGTHFVRLVE